VNEEAETPSAQDIAPSLGEHVQARLDAHGVDTSRRPDGDSRLESNAVARRSSSACRYARMPTERTNRAARDLDRLSALEIARLMNREDRRPAQAVRRVAPAIARAVDMIVEALDSGGRLIFVGAGTSGRLGVLEAAECPPTFGTPPRLVQAIMAGGRAAVFRAREGVEDDTRAARRAVQARTRRGDVVVGISASGVTPFVRGALTAAGRLGARTVLVACHVGEEPPPAEIVIAPWPGPEVLAGSTRLKAGTTTKLVLNTLTTASMVRLGKVYGNRMVDLQPRSRKLRERAVRLVQELAGVSRERAQRALRAGGQRARVAIVIARLGLRAADARAALRRHQGSLRAILGAPRSS
jgi:N-acetylmuramic acid 6-phosphate etherase